MVDTPNPATLTRHDNTTVVLLAPELFGSLPEPATLKATLIQPHARIRLLMRLASPDDLALAEALALDSVAVELLLPAGMDLPATRLPVARMPPGSTETDTDELALALSDVLLIGHASSDAPLVRLARKLNKRLHTPGIKLPSLVTARRSITYRLDPEQAGWHRMFRRLWGRLEQFLLELAAFNWQGRRHGGIAKSRHRLHVCLFSRAWYHLPYFAPEEPENWKELVPDRTALDANSPIVARFDRLDRSALLGAYIHRDMAWVAHLAAAFAVLFAVLGHTGLFLEGVSWLWPLLELLALIAIVAATVFLRSVKLLDRWTACRFGAEQLRIARMCLPLLVVPSALCSVDGPARGDHSGQALTEVKRAVRDQGLPHLSPAASPLDAARWVAFMVADQNTYHRNNHRKLHCAERRLNGLTIVLFLLALVAVCLQFFLGHSSWLLIFTAAGPAFAGAVHGVATRLGLVHRIQLSEDAEKELLFIHDELQGLIVQPPEPEAAWIAVRKLAFLAAEAMGRETRSWHSQVRRQKDELT